MSEDLNERIARALGWKSMADHLRGEHPGGSIDRFYEKNPGVKLLDEGNFLDPAKQPRRLPDYAGSVDACLPVLADKGWRWSVGSTWAWIETAREFVEENTAASPAAALAECIALALEAEKSPD